MPSVVRQRMQAAINASVFGPICAVILALGVVNAAAETTVVFGTYASDKPTEIVSQINPTLSEISRKIEARYGEKVFFHMQIVHGYKKGVDDLVAKKFDIMRLGPASYVMAKRRAPEISILAMEKKRGRKTTYGVIAVHKDSPLTGLAQLRGRSFAFGSKRSTEGRFFAQLALARAGVLAKDLRRFEYLGRYDKIGRAVGAKLFVAGALEETVFTYLKHRGVPIRALVTYACPSNPWVAREGFDPALARKIREAVLSITDKATLQALRFEGFLPGGDADYQGARHAMEDNHMFFKGYWESDAPDGAGPDKAEPPSATSTVAVP